MARQGIEFHSKESGETELLQVGSQITFEHKGVIITRRVSRLKQEAPFGAVITFHTRPPTETTVFLDKIIAIRQGSNKAGTNPQPITIKGTTYASRDQFAAAIGVASSQVHGFARVTEILHNIDPEDMPEPGTIAPRMVMKR